MTEEEKYIKKRRIKASIQSILFYLNRIIPVNKKKIVFTTIEGTTGYTCNPKYIAKELIKQNRRKEKKDQYELVWLVNDTIKEFPDEIKVVKNTLFNRAHQLSTAKFWIDNSRKQLECRKRKGQIYIQTWHAKLGFKPTCLDRGESFSKIAYLVSKHDSDMVDYWLSNSDWYDKTLKTGSLYEGKTLRTGSPRCDILVKAKNDKNFKSEIKMKLCELYGVNKDNKNNLDEIHFLMYAPTFRGGSQGINRTVDVGNHFPDYKSVKDALEKKFGGKWYIMLRLHPQLIARGFGSNAYESAEYIVDGSIRDDMYELLAGCDAFVTDYSSAAFDAMVMDIPIFLYCDDYEEYEGERGSLLWDLKKLPFPFAENTTDLIKNIDCFENAVYKAALSQLYKETGMKENGEASQKLVEFLQ